MSTSLEHAFHQGFGRHARPHQVEAVNKLLAQGFGSAQKSFLLQHAPGSGKTEVIGLLALASLQRRLFSYIVILNYAIDLEEQAVQRLEPFFARFGVPCKRAETSCNVHKRLRSGCVYFSLLQKFSADENDSPDYGESSMMHI